MNEAEHFQEAVSALTDGQLEGDAFVQTVERIGDDDGLRVAWHHYHLIGEVLRTGTHASGSDSAAFLTRFQQRLAAQPVVLTLPTPKAPAPERARDSANESVFRWKLTAAAAALVAVMAMGLFAYKTPLAASDAQLADAVPMPTVVPGDAGQPVMLRDPKLDALLEAHRQVAGDSQMPSGFLRDATFETPAR